MLWNHLHCNHWTDCPSVHTDGVGAVASDGICVYPGRGYDED